MKVVVLYSMDRTTHTDTFTGHKITTQITPQQGGAIAIYNEQGKTTQTKLYSLVYTMEKIYE
jgi:hypothetical protein